MNDNRFERQRESGCPVHIGEVVRRVMADLERLRRGSGERAAVETRPELNRK